MKDIKEPVLEKQIVDITTQLDSLAAEISELATRQQRLIGYRQCLVDMKENATTKNTRTS
jgi:hypothetical protein